MPSPSLPSFDVSCPLPQFLVSRRLRPFVLCLCVWAQRVEPVCNSADSISRRLAFHPCAAIEVKRERIGLALPRARKARHEKRAVSRPQVTKSSRIARKLRSKRTHVLGGAYKTTISGAAGCLLDGLAALSLQGAAHPVEKHADKELWKETMSSFANNALEHVAVRAHALGGERSLATRGKTTHFAASAKHHALARNTLTSSLASKLRVIKHLQRARIA